MALSEPEHGVFDPKAHLQPALSDMDMDSKAYDTPLQPYNFNDTPPDSTASKNISAHQANAMSATHDFGSPSTNGYHESSSPAHDNESFLGLRSSVPGSTDTTQTRTSSPPPSKQVAADSTLMADEANVEVESIEPSPSVFQPPTSDVREAVQPERPGANTGEPANDKFLDNPQDTLATDFASPARSISPSAPNGSAAGGVPRVGKQETPSEFTSNRTLQASGTELSASMDPTSTNENADTISAQTSSPAPTQNATPDAPVDPASSPSATAGLCSQTPVPDSSSTDQVMMDAPLLSKTGRAREEDDSEDAPAAKRTRTEEAGSQEGFRVPDRPQIDPQAASQPSQPETTQPPPSPMTKPRQKYLQKAITNLKRIQAAKPFLVPVDPVALNIPAYFEYIKNPMDLKTLEENLRSDKYSSVDAFVADFNLIVQNSQNFNGESHAVTKQALSMQEYFDRNIATLPTAEVQDTGTSKKKAPDSMAIRAPPARRESRSSLPGSARSPGSATSPQTFALGPEGMPLIRRDSTIDGRPKREIHRPAPKDLPYSNHKPKKKKFQWELKFCDHVLKELVKPKYQAYSAPFMVPVDPVALNIPTYLSVIKKPMDFGTIKQRLDRGEYENAKEFEADARLVFKNCFLFNIEGDQVYNLGKRFETIFNEEWSKKRDWLEENTPSSGQRSPASSEDEESGEDEEEEEEDEGQMEIVSKLQKQIAEMSKQVEMITSGAKKKTPPTAIKKAAKPTKTTKKDTKKSAPAPPKADKKTASKPSRRDKAPYVTYEQKQDISQRINSLSETKMTQALAIIRNNMPNLKGVQEDELELDIDELSNDVLYKLLQFVRKHAPRADDSPLPTVATSSTAGPQRKKNKPMSKHEQEARIAQVQSGLSAFQKGAAGGPSMDVQQSIENQSDEEDEEDSESEEE